MKLPSCIGNYDSNGDYDCDSNHDQICEDCLCNYHTTGGLWHPITGKKLSRFRIFLFYGRRKPKKRPKALGFWRDISK